MPGPSSGLATTIGFLERTLNSVGFTLFCVSRTISQGPRRLRCNGTLQDGLPGATVVQTGGARYLCDAIRKLEMCRVCVGSGAGRDPHWRWPARARGTDEHRRPPLRIRRLPRTGHVLRIRRLPQSVSAAYPSTMEAQTCERCLAEAQEAWDPAAFRLDLACRCPPGLRRMACLSTAMGQPRRRVAAPFVAFLLRALGAAGVTELVDPSLVVSAHLRVMRRGVGSGGSRQRVERG